MTYYGPAVYTLTELIRVDDFAQQFKICWLDESKLRRSIVACYMDGRPVGGKPSQKNASGVLEGVYTPSNRLRRFQFSSVVTTGKCYVVFKIHRVPHD